MLLVFDFAAKLSKYALFEDRNNVKVHCIVILTNECHFCTFCFIVCPFSLPHECTQFIMHPWWFVYLIFVTLLGIFFSDVFKIWSVMPRL